MASLSHMMPTPAMLGFFLTLKAANLQIFDVLCLHFQCWQVPSKAHKFLASSSLVRKGAQSRNWNMPLRNRYNFSTGNCNSRWWSYCQTTWKAYQRHIQRSVRSVSAIAKVSAAQGGGRRCRRNRRNWGPGSTCADCGNYDRSLSRGSQGLGFHRHTVTISNYQ
jgi:hypothetical protein